MEMSPGQPMGNSGFDTGIGTSEPAEVIKLRKEAEQKSRQQNRLQLEQFILSEITRNQGPSVLSVPLNNALKSLRDLLNLHDKQATQQATILYSARELQINMGIIEDIVGRQNFREVSSRHLLLSLVASILGVGLPALSSGYQVDATEGVDQDG